MTASNRAGNPSAERLGHYQTASSVATVLHIEDDHLWAATSAALMSTWPEVRHVGSFANGRDGLAACGEKRPGVVLLDLTLPDLDGLVLLDRLNALRYPPAVLLFTGRKDEALLHRLGAGGVAGLLWKSPDFALLLRPALTAVASGQVYLPSEVKSAVRRFRAAPDAFFKILSPRELELVSLLARGLKDEDIAEATGRTGGTIRNHWYNIAAKLDLRDRHEIRRWAITKGFGREAGLA
jgi:DNA-binding NarL/FixJ family response regulator